MKRQNKRRHRKATREVAGRHSVGRLCQPKSPDARISSNQCELCGELIDRRFGCRSDPNACRCAGHHHCLSGVTNQCGWNTMLRGSSPQFVERHGSIALKDHLGHPMRKPADLCVGRRLQERRNRCVRHLCREFPSGKAQKLIDHDNLLHRGFNAGPAAELTEDHLSSSNPICAFDLEDVGRTIAEKR